MNVLSKIALSSVKLNFKKNLRSQIAILFSMTIISFLAFFIYNLNSFFINNRSYTSLPITKFLEQVISLMTALIVFLIIITAFTIYVYSSVRREEREKALAVLTSVGATDSQKALILIIETAILYISPIIIGTVLGIFPANFLSEKLIFTFALNGIIKYKIIDICLLALSLSLIGILLMYFCSALPTIRIRSTLIQAIKKHNNKESQSKHSYRNSYTFKSSPITSRLAKLSVDYNSASYMRISIMFSSVILYPVIAFAFLKRILGEKIILDENPYDAIDTAASVLRTVGDIMVFIFALLLILLAVGVIQLIYLIKIQNKKRSDSFMLYTSVGMTDRQFKDVLKKEYLTVFGKALIILIFLALFIFFVFEGL